MGKRIALLGSVALLGAPDIAQAQSTPSPTLLDTCRQKIEIIDARNQALISRNAGLMTENEALRRELAALKGGKAPSKTGAPLPSSVVRANNTPVFPDSDPPSSPLRTLPPARIVPSLAPRPVQGPQDYVFRTHLDGYIKSGRERTLAGTELWIPLTWNGELLTFADARLVADDSEGREGNFGLGARLLPAGWPALVGGYAYYDRRRSESGSVFEQATLGAELLSSEWDLRANVYLALSDPSISEYSSLDTDFALRGRTIIATQTATENIVRETPLSGFDLEAGHKVSFLEGSWMDDTRAYASWYHFDGDGVDPVDGYRIRLRTSLTDWLQVGLEHQDDGLRGSDQFAELRVRFPFGDTPRSHRPRGLYKRLDERVVRDIDIVTASATATQSQTVQSTVTNVASGVAQDIITVDNTAAGGGDGSAETPFNTLAAAQAAAGTNDIIYIRAGDGTNTGLSSGITLDDSGQRLIGSGTDLTFDRTFMSALGLRLPSLPMVIAPATTAPVLTNTAVNGDGITVTANNVHVAGVNVRAAQRDGIVVNADNVTLSDLTVTDSVRYGIYATANGAASNIEDLQVQNSTLTRNGSYGLYLHAQAGGDFTSPSLSDLTISDNIGYGSYLFSTGAGSTIASPSLSNLLIEDNSDSGLVINAAAGASITAPTLSNITANENAFHGVWIQATGAGSTVSNLSADTLTLTRQAGATAGTPLPSGLYVFADTGGTISAPRFSHIDAVNNGSYGIHVRSNGAAASITAPLFSDVAANSNGDHGVYVIAQAAGTISGATFETFEAQDNTLDGLRLLATGAGSAITTPSLRGITSTDNGDDGLYIEAAASGTLSNLSLSEVISSDNGSEGLYMRSTAAGSTLSNATLTDIHLEDNGDYGGYILTSVSASMASLNIADLTSIDNSNDGLHIESNGAGSTMANLSLADLTLNSNADYGLYLYAVTSGVLNAPTLTRITANGNDLSGVLVQANAVNAAINGLNLSEVTTQDNAVHGLYINATNTATVSSPVIQNILSEGNGSSGVYLYAATANATISNALVSDITVTGSGDYGFYLTNQPGGRNTGGQFSNISVADSGLTGIYLETTGAGSVFSNAAFSNLSSVNSGDYGLYFLATTGASVTAPTFSHLTSTSSGLDGMRFTATAAGTVLSGLSVTDATVTESNDHGLVVLAGTGASFTTPTLSALTISDSGLNGFYLSANGAAASLSGATVSDLSVSGSGDHGVYVYAAAAGSITNASLDEVTIEDSGVDGLHMEATATGSTISGASLTDIDVGDSGGMGAYLLATTNASAITTPTLARISVHDSTLDGMRLHSAGVGSALTGASLSDVSIEDSLDYGLYLYASSSGAFSAKVENSTATNNLQYGVFVDDDTTGAFTADLGGGALGGTGGNRIFNNLLQDIRADMDNGQLKAEGNWWGSTTGLSASESILDGTSTIDSAPFLAADPGP